MAAGINHTLDQLMTYGSERVSLVGSFFTNGTSSPVAGTVTGGFFTVARTGVGAYLLTFADQLVNRPAIFADLQQATPNGASAYPGVFTPATATTPATLVVLLLTAAGAAVEVAANANNQVHIELRVKNTGVAVPA